MALLFSPRMPLWDETRRRAPQRFRELALGLPAAVLARAVSELAAGEGGRLADEVEREAPPLSLERAAPELERRALGRRTRS